MIDFSQFVFSGIATGCIYALVALGFVLCSNVSGVVNFVQGEYVVYGGLIAASLIAHLWPLWAAVTAAVVACALLGMLQERLTLAPVRKAPDFIQITITLGVAVLLRGLALIIWGKDPLSMPPFPGGEGVFPLFGALLPGQHLWVWGATFVFVALTFFYLKHTASGRAVRACSSNAYAAQLMGINPALTTLVVFGVSAGLGALGGAVITPIALAPWDGGLDYGLKGFIGAIIGGFKGPGMAVAGGLGLGLVESLAAGYISAGAKDIVSYGVVLLYLMIRGGVLVTGRGAAALSERSN
ncbi:MAG: branched-chain amino acid ABC transporter permease [Burkholderiales bacterium]|nr:branched-chain amino acid ABC transporter permease [Burkholderiales bacterium]